MSDALEQAKIFFENATAAHDSELYVSMDRWIALAQVATGIAQAEHLEHIRNHLDDIGTALIHAEGPDGALKVDVRE